MPPEQPAPRAGAGLAPGLSDRAALMRVLSSPWIAQSCYALAKLGLPDLMLAGPRPVAQLAAGSGTNTRALLRLLRALAAAGLVHEAAPGVFGLTGVTQLLTSGAPRSSRPSVIMFGEEVFRSFAEILYTLRTGRPAFEKVYGRPFYDYINEHREAAQTFASAMGGAPVPQALAACDLTGLRTLVDVGGGNGGLLAKVLPAHPAARGILVDMPEAVRQARERLAAAGVGDRVEFVTGSFFADLPAGGDIYVLARVLHNWDDDDAVALLRNVRSAMATDGRLIVFEQLMRPVGGDDDGDRTDGAAASAASPASAGRPASAASPASAVVVSAESDRGNGRGDAAGTAGPSAARRPAAMPAGGAGAEEPGVTTGRRPGRSAAVATQDQIMDLLILLMLPGCDRTEAEYRALLAEAGFEVSSVRSAPLRAPGAESAIEAVPSATRRPARRPSAGQPADTPAAPPPTPR
jgi:hypothetical protein